MLEIFVPAIEVTEPEPQRLPPATLRFPTAVAADALLFDRILNNMIHFGERSEPPANFSAWMDRESVASPADRFVLRETYGVMRRLQGEGRNHIWGYVARNLARPVWLASEAQKADVVIGNPPWVSYRFMSGEFKKRFRNECQAAGLWVGGKVAPQQDLAGYFHVRAASLYLRRTGADGPGHAVCRAVTPSLGVVPQGRGETLQPRRISAPLHRSLDVRTGGATALPGAQLRLVRRGS